MTKEPSGFQNLHNAHAGRQLLLLKQIQEPIIPSLCMTFLLRPVGSVYISRGLFSTFYCLSSGNDSHFHLVVSEGILPNSSFCVCWSTNISLLPYLHHCTSQMSNTECDCLFFCITPRSWFMHGIIVKSFSHCCSIVIYRLVWKIPLML